MEWSFLSKHNAEKTKVPENTFLIYEWALTQSMCKQAMITFQEMAVFNSLYGS